MLTDFLKDYLSIIIFLFIALGLSVGFIFLNFLFLPKNPDSTPWYCSLVLAQSRIWVEFKDMLKNF